MQICLSIMQTVTFVMQYTCIKEDVRTSACVEGGGGVTVNVCLCTRLCSSSCIIYSEARSFSCTISYFLLRVLALVRVLIFVFCELMCVFVRLNENTGNFVWCRNALFTLLQNRCPRWCDSQRLCSETLQRLLSYELLVILVGSLQITPPTKTHTSCLDLFISGEVNVFPGVCEQQEEVGGWDWRRFRQFASKHLLCQLSAALQYYRESVSQQMHTFPLETIFVSHFSAFLTLFFAA